MPTPPLSDEAMLEALRDADIKLQHIYDLSKPERRAK